MATSPQRELPVQSRLGELESDVQFQLNQLRGTLQSSEQDTRQREAFDSALRIRMGEFEKQLMRLSSNTARIEEAGRGQAQLNQDLSERFDAHQSSSSTDARDIRTSMLEHISHVREEVNAVSADQSVMRTLLNEHLAEFSERLRKQKTGFDARLHDAHRDSESHFVSRVEELKCSFSRHEKELSVLKDVLKEHVETTVCDVKAEMRQGLVEVRGDALDAARERAEMVEKLLEAHLSQVQVEHQTQIVADRQATHVEMESLRYRLDKVVALQEDRLEEAQQLIERSLAQCESYTSKQLEEMLACLRREVSQSVTNMNDVIERKAKRLQVEMEEMRSNNAMERNIQEEVHLQAKAANLATEQLRTALDDLRAAELSRRQMCEDQLEELQEQRRGLDRRLQQACSDALAQTEDVRRQLQQELRTTKEATLALAEEQSRTSKEWSS